MSTSQQRDPVRRIAGVRSPALAHPRRLGLPPSFGYVYQGEGQSLTDPQQIAALIRRPRPGRVATAEDAPLADSFAAPAEVHRERADADMPAPAPPPPPPPAEWCGRCGYQTRRCGCPGGPRGGGQ